MNHTVAWLRQRYTAVLMVPLVVWFLCIFCEAFAGHDGLGKELSKVLSKPHASFLFLVMSIAMLYHGVLGMSMVVPDYVKCPTLRLVIMPIVKGSALVTGLLVTFAVFKSVLC